MQLWGCDRHLRQTFFFFSFSFLTTRRRSRQLGKGQNIPKNLFTLAKFGGGDTTGTGTVGRLALGRGGSGG